MLPLLNYVHVLIINDRRPVARSAHGAAVYDGKILKNNFFPIIFFQGINIYYQIPVLILKQIRQVVDICWI